MWEVRHLPGDDDGQGNQSILGRLAWRNSTHLTCGHHLHRGEVAQTQGMEGEGEVNLESDEVLPSDDDKDEEWESINEEDSPQCFYGRKEHTDR